MKSGDLLLSITKHSIVRVKLPWPESGLWKNRSAGQHWSVGYESRRDQRLQGKVLAIEAMQALFSHHADGFLIAPGTHLVIYVFHPENRHAFDMNGAYSALKNIEDGVADALGINDRLFRPIILMDGAIRERACVMMYICEEEATEPDTDESRGTTIGLDVS